MLEIVQGFTNVMLSTGEQAAETLEHSAMAAEQALQHGQARFLDGQWRGDAGARDCKLFVPAAYHGQPLPLIVMLHGCRQDPADFAAGTRMNALAEEMACLVLYPGQSRSANGFNCWNWFSQDDQQRGLGEPAIIAGMTRHIINTWHVDTARVYVAGLSAGGAMAVIMGKTYPDLFAAIGVHSGLAYAGAHDMQSALRAMRIGAPLALSHPEHGALLTPASKTMATIVFHGDSDTTEHPDNGDRVIEQITPAPMASGEPPPQCDLTIVRGEVDQGHAFTRTIHHCNDSVAAVAEQWVVHGAGHAWSGGSNDGSYSDPKGPDASREMLRFFLSQQRNAGQGNLAPAAKP
ncbi:MAG: extracellular catalytic domain type 1 short-chain-length polyhydroxyalkanoate depolymerase [Janthinobacterium lividum]